MGNEVWKAIGDRLQRAMARSGEFGEGALD